MWRRGYCVPGQSGSVGLREGTGSCALTPQAALEGPRGFTEINMFSLVLSIFFLSVFVSNVCSIMSTMLCTLRLWATTKKTQDKRVIIYEKKYYNYNKLNVLIKIIRIS